MLLFTVAFVDFNLNNTAYFKYEYNFFQWLLFLFVNFGEFRNKPGLVKV